ncbi:DUF6221 family protein [Angustibacter aerolatus]
MDLREFLLARIAEDEARARTAAEDGTTCTGGWPPQRLLVECETRRELLRLDLDQAVCEDADRGCGHSGTDIEQGRCERQSADDRPLLRALALPWSTHPQHRDAWLP